MSKIIAQRRHELKAQIIDSPKHWRILFLGRSVNGSTDIVSCLARALQNLGHKVLNLDTARHGLVSNPLKMQGGNGPVYVNAEKLIPVLDRFQPQIVVFCAGGLGLTEESAEIFKSRSVITLGVTLSDPDVLPTVANYASLFDFHTTNAAKAMGLYEERGVKNTLYFPFAIDRGYITQDLPPAPELDADVICLGHATSRPERDDVMSLLAKSFNVKTYGRGWSLPGSFTVEGTRQIQAARHGRCHVNFAATRAGYINIKCGVFETIGSGALLCTAKFDEMKHFFSYEDEILGWDTVEELHEQLQTILGDPGRHQEMVERAFLRLTNEHLYEHRWLDLFAQIEAVLDGVPAWMGSSRAGELKSILSESSGRAKNVILSGFYGARNAGDELILKSIADAIESASPEHQVIVAAENPLAVEIQHGYSAFKRANHLHADHACKNAAAIVVGGGGLWHDYTFERSGGIRGLFTGAQISIAGFGILPLMGTVRGVPFHTVGLGVGPLDRIEARQATRFLACHAAHIDVRDAESFRILEEIGVPTNKITQTPDVVYGVSLVDYKVGDDLRQRAGNRKIVGVSVRHWKKQESVELLRRLAAELDHIGRNESVVFVGVPMQEGEKHDRDALKVLFALMTCDSERWTIEAYVGVDNLVSYLGQFDVLVGMRLHACLVAHRLGVPVVGLAYDPKVFHHFNEIGRREFVFNLEALESNVATAATLCLSGKGNLSEMTKVAIRGFEIESGRMLEKMGGRLSEAAVNLRSYEIAPELAMHEQAKEVNAGAEKQAFPTTFRVWQPAISRPALRMGEQRAAMFNGDDQDKWLNVGSQGKKTSRSNVEWSSVLDERRSDRGHLSPPAHDENGGNLLTSRPKRYPGISEIDRNVPDYEPELEQSFDTGVTDEAGVDVFSGRRRPEDKQVDGQRADRVSIREARRRAESDLFVASDRPSIVGRMTADRVDTHEVSKHGGEFTQSASRSSSWKSSVSDDTAEAGRYQINENSSDRISEDTPIDRVEDGWYIVRMDGSRFGGTFDGVADASICDYRQANRSASIRFLKDSPKKGDSVYWELTIPLVKTERFEIEINLDKNYSRPKNAGWMAYTLHVNNQLFLIEDFALRSGKNIVTVLVGNVEKIDVRVSVTALRDCKPWAWQKVSLLSIDEVVLRRTDVTGNLNVVASSPYSRAGAAARRTHLFERAMSALNIR